MLRGTTVIANRKSVNARLAMTQFDNVRKCRNPMTDISTSRFPNRIHMSRIKRPRNIQRLCPLTGICSILAFESFGFEGSTLRLLPLRPRGKRNIESKSEVFCRNATSWSISSIFSSTSHWTTRDRHCIAILRFIRWCRRLTAEVGDADASETSSDRISL